MRLSWFAFIIIALFAIELADPVREFVVQPFTAIIASISAGITQLFDSSVQAQGIIMRSTANNVAVAIKPGCNGVEAMIVLAAAIIAFPASWKSRLHGLFFGFIAIQVLNIIRIISLFYFLQWDKEWFDWMHLYVWQALIILDALIIFIIWIRVSATTNKEKS